MEGAGRVDVAKSRSCRLAITAVIYVTVPNQMGSPHLGREPHFLHDVTASATAFILELLAHLESHDVIALICKRNGDGA